MEVMAAGSALAKEAGSAAALEVAAGSDTAVGARTGREATGLAGHQEDTSVAGTAAAVDVATAREWAVAKAATEAMGVRAA